MTPTPLLYDYLVLVVDRDDRGALSLVSRSAPFTRARRRRVEHFARSTARASRDRVVVVFRVDRELTLVPVTAYVEGRAAPEFDFSQLSVPIARLGGRAGRFSLAADPHYHEDAHT